MKNIYILLTRSQTILSRLIHLATNDTYTHASIAWDDELTTLCSFARRHSSLPLPAGLVREELCGGYYDLHRYMPCALLRLSVDDETHRLLREQIEKMLSDAARYRYSVAGLLCCRAGRELERDGRCFCSQFVAGILENCGAVALPKAPSLMRPEDLLHLPGIQIVHTGRLCDLTHPSLADVCAGNVVLTPALGIA